MTQSLARVARIWIGNIGLEIKLLVHVVQRAPLLYAFLVPNSVSMLVAEGGKMMMVSIHSTHTRGVAGSTVQPRREHRCGDLGPVPRPRPRPRELG
jgi:hypothetical protein